MGTKKLIKKICLASLMIIVFLLQFSLVGVVIADSIGSAFVNTENYYELMSSAEERTALLVQWEEELKNYGIHFQMIDPATPPGFSVKTSVIVDNAYGDAFWAMYGLVHLPQPILSLIQSTGEVDIFISEDESQDLVEECSGIKGASGWAGNHVIAINAKCGKVVVHELGHIIYSRLKTINFGPTEPWYGLFDELDAIFKGSATGKQTPVPAGFFAELAMENANHDFTVHFAAFSAPYSANEFKMRAFEEMLQGKPLLRKKYLFLKKLYSNEEYTSFGDPKPLLVLMTKWGKIYDSETKKDILSWAKKIYPGDGFAVKFKVVYEGLSSSEVLTPVLEIYPKTGIASLVPVISSVTKSTFPKDGWFQFNVMTTSTVPRDQDIQVKFYFKNKSGQIVGKTHSVNLVLNASHFISCWDESGIKKLTPNFKNMDFCANDLSGLGYVSGLKLGLKRTQGCYYNYLALSTDFDIGMYSPDKKGGLGYDNITEGKFIVRRSHFMPVADAPILNHDNDSDPDPVVNLNSRIHFDGFWVLDPIKGTYIIKTIDQRLLLIDKSLVWLGQFSGWQINPLLDGTKPKLIVPSQESAGGFYAGCGYDVWRIAPDGTRNYAFITGEVIHSIAYTNLNSPANIAVAMGDGMVELYNWYKDASSQVGYKWVDEFILPAKVEAMSMSGNFVYASYPTATGHQVVSYSIKTGQVKFILATTSQIKQLLPDIVDGSVYVVMKVDTSNDLIMRVSSEGKFISETNIPTIGGLEINDINGYDYW